MPVLCFLDDLIFISKIKTIAQALGVEIRFGQNNETAPDLVRETNPSLVIIDLNSSKLKPIELVQSIKAIAAIPVVGFVSHVDSEIFDKAKQAGCIAWPRSKFVSELSALLQGNIKP